MAIINSLGVGRGRKSAGNLTYRTVRGRCIASQKREKTGNQSGAISVAQATFSIISTFMRAHASDIDVSFAKSTYGSQRNSFYKLNKSALRAAVNALAVAYSASKTRPSITEIDAAVGSYATANPTAIVRVNLPGFDQVYMDGPWSSDDNPISGGAVDELGTGTVSTVSADYNYTAPVSASLKFYSGAKIVRDAGTVTITCAGIPAGVAAGAIKYLTAGGSVIDSITITNVASSAVGRIQYTAPAIAESANALAVRISNVYVRLTSAYVQESTGEDGGL